VVADNSGRVVWMAGMMVGRVVESSGAICGISKDSVRAYIRSIDTADVPVGDCGERVSVGSGDSGGVLRGASLDVLTWFAGA
jgi:hypothetical protein